MFRLTPEDAFQLLREWLTEHAPVIAERGMEIAVPRELFTDAWSLAAVG